ncbi:hypothetical protein hamaS1_20550 [Moorella sp. Hama-1]|nr:hypothetical protein hamaS1_20550 [Moorella sp. Hama-1]
MGFEAFSKLSDTAGRRLLVFDLILGGLVTVALLAYLVYALMQAERL